MRHCTSFLRGPNGEQPSRTKRRRLIGVGPFSHHLLAVWRALAFAGAAVTVIVPMAIAARHVEAKATLVRSPTLAASWSLDLSAAVAGGLQVSVPRAFRPGL